MALLAGSFPSTRLSACKQTYQPAFTSTQLWRLPLASEIRGSRKAGRFQRKHLGHVCLSAKETSWSQSQGELPTVLSRLDCQEAAGTTKSDKEDADARTFALECASVLDETKCQDITVLHVAPLVTWCSYLVFATVMSKPQLLAALARVEKMAKDGEDGGRERLNQPGSSPWEALDYGSVVIHLFTQEQRELYDVEGFYAAAEEVELPFSLQLPSQGSPAWTS